jgi:prepilin-type N-terminal cleavage/methylation domain-containing protein
MKLSQVKRSGGLGFTLVELLIVIAIISVLLSLVSSAVWKAVVTANRVRNQNEISQLATAVENFKQKFGIYPPSRIILCEIYDYYFQGNKRGNPPKSQLHADSLQFLQTIWPRINFNFVNKPAIGSSSRWNGIDWNGDGKPTPGEFLLEGDQCLVFFLGGIPGVDPTTGRLFCGGFSTNPQNPAYQTLAVGSEIIQPFFDFQSDRLISLPKSFRTNQSIGSSFYSYKDTYGNVPYAYFSSYKTSNGYNRYNSSDCDSLGVWPYAQGLVPTPRYLNPNTFQIISAGANGALVGTKHLGFGRGTDLTNPNSIWTPQTAGISQAIWGYNNDKQAGVDDQSNFYDSTLGTAASGTGS